MTYNDILQRQPTPAQHGDRDAAQAFVILITETLHGSDASYLSPSQKTYLYRLYHKWSKRALGEDVKWMLRRPAPGRPPSSQGRRVIGDDELDPLSRRIIEKYGRDTDEP